MHTGPDWSKDKEKRCAIHQYVRTYTCMYRVPTLQVYVSMPRPHQNYMHSAILGLRKFLDNLRGTYTWLCTFNVSPVVQSSDYRPPSNNYISGNYLFNRYTIYDSTWLCRHWSSLWYKRRTSSFNNSVSRVRDERTIPNEIKRKSGIIIGIY